MLCWWPRWWSGKTGGEPRVSARDTPLIHGASTPLPIIWKDLAKGLVFAFKRGEISVALHEVFCHGEVKDLALYWFSNKPKLPAYIEYQAPLIEHTITQSRFKAKEGRATVCREIISQR